MSDPVQAQSIPESLAQRALDLADEAVCIVDARQPGLPVVWVNAAFERITGYSAAEVLGRNPRFLQGGDRDQPELAELHAAVASGRPVRVTLRNYRADGTLFLNALRLEPVTAGDGSWWIGFSRDVTEEYRREADLGRRGDELEGLKARLAELDPVDRVTGLNNARAFDAELARSWFVCTRERRKLALFVFAPDYFDVYGETFGRTASESCLRMLGRAVAGCFRRASDAVGRTGEAEFGTLALDMEPEEARAHAQRVLERARGLAMHNPRAPTGRYLTLSAGVAIGRPGADRRWDGMVLAARNALAQAREDGWERVVLSELQSTG